MNACIMGWNLDRIKYKIPMPTHLEKIEELRYGGHALYHIYYMVILTSISSTTIEILPTPKCGREYLQGYLRIIVV
jgi:hypothetical protein